MLQKCPAWFDRAWRYRNVLFGTEPKNVIVKDNFSEKQACLADKASHRLGHLLVVDFPVQMLTAADGPVGSGRGGGDKQIAQLVLVP